MKCCRTSLLHCSSVMHLGGHFKLDLDRNAANACGLLKLCHRESFASVCSSTHILLSTSTRQVIARAAGIDMALKTLLIKAWEPIMCSGELLLMPKLSWIAQIQMFLYTDFVFTEHYAKYGSLITPGSTHEALALILSNSFTTCSVRVSGLT